MDDYKNIAEEKEPEVQYFCRFTFGQFFTMLVLEVVTLAFVFYLGAKYGTDYLKIEGKEEQSVAEVVAGGAVSVGQPQAVPQDAELQAMARDVVQGRGEADLKTRVKELLEKQQGGQGTVTGGQQGQQGQQVVEQSNHRTIEPSNQNGLPAQTIQQQGQQGQQGVQGMSTQDSGVIRMKSPVGSRYSIQVGSYPNMDEANSKVEDWRGRGYPSFMMIADIPDRGRWYRVRIGGFATKEDAQAYLEKFKANEGTEGIVVLNEQ